MENTNNTLDVLQYINPHPRTNYSPDRELFTAVQKFLGLSDLIMMHFIYGATIQKVYYYISTDNELICQITRPRITPNEKKYLDHFAQTAAVKQFKPINSDYEPMLSSSILNVKKVWETKMIVAPESKSINNPNNVSFENKQQFLSTMLGIRQQFKEVFLHHIATLMDIKAHLPLNDMLKTYHDKKYEDIIPYVSPNSFVKQIHHTTSLKEWLCPKCKYFYAVSKKINRSVVIAEKEVYITKDRQETEYEYEHFYDIQFINNPNIEFTSEEEKDFYTTATTYHLQQLIGDEKFEFGKQYLDKHQNNLSAFQFGLDYTHYNFQTCLHKTDYYLPLSNLGNDYQNIKKHISEVVANTAFVSLPLAGVTHATIGLAAAQSALVALPAMATATATANTALALSNISTIMYGAVNLTACMTPLGVGIYAVVVSAAAIKLLPEVANSVVNTGYAIKDISQGIINSNTTQRAVQKLKQCTPWFLGAKKANAILHAQCTEIKEYLDIKMACLIETGHVNCVSNKEFAKIFFDDNWYFNLQSYQPTDYKNEFKNLASEYTNRVCAHTKDNFGVAYK